MTCSTTRAGAGSGRGVVVVLVVREDGDDVMMPVFSTSEASQLLDKINGCYTVHTQGQCGTDGRVNSNRFQVHDASAVWADAYEAGTHWEIMSEQ